MTVDSSTSSARLSLHLETELSSRTKKSSMSRLSFGMERAEVSYFWEEVNRRKVYECDGWVWFDGTSNLCFRVRVELNSTLSLRKRMTPRVSSTLNRWVGWNRSGLIVEMKPGLVVSHLCTCTTHSDVKKTHHNLGVGSTSDPNLKGHLHYPNDIDRSLNEVSTDMIPKYKDDCNNNPPNVISFIPIITSASGRLHSEFVTLLFLQDHRETDPFFAVSGVAQTDRDQFHFRCVSFSSHLKSRVGNILVKAVDLRITLHHTRKLHLGSFCWTLLHNILHPTTTPYTPYGNGKVENGIGLIKTLTRTMLISSDLTKNHWYMSVRYPTYITNKISTCPSKTHTVWQEYYKDKYSRREYFRRWPTSEGGQLLQDTVGRRWPTSTGDCRVVNVPYSRDHYWNSLGTDFLRTLCLRGEVRGFISLF